jgi:hypothetical protein
VKVWKESCNIYLCGLCTKCMKWKLNGDGISARLWKSGCSTLNAIDKFDVIHKIGFARRIYFLFLPANGDPSFQTSSDKSYQYYVKCFMLEKFDNFYTMSISLRIVTSHMYVILCGQWYYPTNLCVLLSLIWLVCCKYICCCSQWISC